MDTDDLDAKLARIRARDELNELIEERATMLAEAEGSTAFSVQLPDDPGRQPVRDDYRARIRLELGMPCCDLYGVGDHDSAAHGGAA